MKLFMRVSIMIVLLTGMLFTSTAAPVRALSGGPDGFDYSFVDSVDPGPNPEKPVYNLEDISASGNLITGLGDAGVSAPLDPGFSFRFYGTSYDRVYVCANGLITFVSPGFDCPYPEAQTLPNGSTPNATVAGWWGDLDLTHSGAIYYAALGAAPNRYFVVEFLNVPHFDNTWTIASPPLDPVTFEFKLFEGSNNIEVHYQAAPTSTLNDPLGMGALIEHSAGVENASGTIGLQYYFDDGALSTPLAVRYYYNDATPPQINITSQPLNPTADPVGIFNFTVSDAGGSGLETVTCQLDHGGFNPCTSPFTTPSLSNASHIFEINALDGASNPSLASYTWTVDTIPPDTTILTNPPSLSGSTSANFTFSGSDSGGSGVLRLECSLDSASFSACSSPRNLTGLSNGSHTFQVQAVDNAGNTDPSPASYTWTVDTIPPDTTITGNPPSLSGSSSASFTFTGSDLSGEDVFECHLDAAAFTSCVSGLTLSGLPDGLHTFYVRAVDAAGNADTTPASYSWVVDTTAPDTSFTANPPNPSASSVADFSFTGSDAGSGILRLECRLDGAVFATCTSPQHLTGLSNGSHTFQVRAVDNIGLTDPTPASYTWVVDTIPPDTTILTNPPILSASASATFTFSGSDTGGSGVLRLECRLDSASFSACSSPRNLTGLSNGSHTFQVQAVDNAGNTDPSPASYTWTVDTIPPDTTITGNPPSLSGSSSASFTFTGSDLSGEDVFECHLDAAAFTSCVSGLTLSGLPDGLHTFYVRAVDAAGNADTTPASYTWVVDTIAPTVTIDTHPANPTNSTTGVFTFTANGTGSAVMALLCKLDGGTYADCISHSASYSGLLDGPHTFSVYAVDAAGNSGLSSPTTYTWTVDTIPPDTTITGNPPGLSGSSSASFTFTGSDGSGSGVAGFECHLDAAAFTSCASGLTLSGLPDGPHTFEVRAVDAAGNKDAFPASYPWVVDTAAPTVTIDTHPANPTNSTTGAFTFTANGTGSAVTALLCKLDGGAYADCISHSASYPGLLDGPHTFSVYAVDAAGNSGLSSPTTYTWTVDTIAPTVTIATHPANPTNSTTGAFTFTANGTGSAVTALSCKLDAGLFADCISHSASYSGLLDGPHTFSVYAVDAAGNSGSSSPTTYTWTVDTVAPAVPVLVSPADAALNIRTSPTLTWQASSGASGYLLILDSGAPVDLGNVTSTITPVLGAGEHTWSVAAKDAAGNISAYAPSFRFTVGWPVFLPAVRK